MCEKEIFSLISRRVIENIFFFSIGDWCRSSRGARAWHGYNKIILRTLETCDGLGLGFPRYIVWT